ncbi:MAG: sensor domain-containing diguanylate cyclase [Candidatus Hinthialibacter antarcticus]|nr:sensor domain-containing diguanylate cyclase [Candidatus Hinthialibacter antarcticus]
MNIRTKLLTSITLILFVGFSLTNYIHYSTSKDALHTNIVDDSLPIISNNIYSEIQQDLMKPVNVSSLMANDTFVKDWLLDGESDLEPIQKYLYEIKQRYGFVSTFLISTRTLNYYHYEGLHKQISPDDPHDDWYYDFLKRDAQYGLDIDTDEAANDNLTIFINHRLLDYDKNLIGVTGAGLSMSQMGAFLAEYQGKFKRNIFLVDPDGVVQIHSNLDLVQTINVFEQEGIQRFRQSILDEKDDLTFCEFDRDGKHILLLTRYIPEFNWYLFVEQDETLTLADIRQNLVYNLIIGLLITCVVIIINVFTINYFQKRLERLASRDELTGAYNRRTFLEKANVEFVRCRRYSKPLSVLMIDLDHFKAINDAHGHAAGDAVLNSIVSTCKTTLRETDLLGRIGGEEFMVLLVETGQERALTAAQRLLESIRQLVAKEQGRSIQTTASIGACLMTPNDKTFDDLMKRADQAMYQAKENGRNRVEFLA